MTDRTLTKDLTDHLEMLARGGMPSPEHAAQLLRRLKFAIHESQRYAASTEANGEIYSSAP